MSDSDKKFDALMARLEQLATKHATVEKELATLRSTQRSSPAPQGQPNAAAAFDMNAYIRDPVGYIARMGANQDQLRHVTQVHFAHALGDAAPAELKVLAQQGPQVSAMGQLASQLTNLSQRFESMQTENVKKTTRESFVQLALDKKTYPHLAAAYAADPILFESAIAQHGGTAADLADSLEKQHATIAAIYKPKVDPSTASDENADVTDNGESPNAELANMAVDPIHSIDPTPPPPPRAKVGLWTPEDHDKLKAEMVRKYTPRAADTQ